MENKIGIWGFGVVGKSALSYLNGKENKIEIFDRKKLSDEEIDFIQKNNATIATQSLEQFLEGNDQIIVSPGIDLLAYGNYANKWVSELDLFNRSWKKPIIAVTGTVGKTSIVHIFSNILKFAGLNVATGGNIGTAMLDLLADQNEKDIAVLEVSSFQLDLCKRFAPDICVWTNLFPNHLDRHGTMQEYFDAKYKIINAHNNEQKIVAHWQLQQQLIEKNPKKSYLFFSADGLEVQELGALRSCDTLYMLENGTDFIKYHNGNKTIVYRGDVPNISYTANWIILVALCDIKNIDINLIKNISFDLPSHRLDHIATICGSEFYNDSKSTIAQSTIQAVKHCSKRPIYLFLGGISKGVDRSNLIKELANQVDTIFCFGVESESLYNACRDFNIKAYKHINLEDSFNSCMALIKEECTVLFSPAGASYDLYRNYNERGEHFVSLVKQYQAKNNIK